MSTDFGDFTSVTFRLRGYDCAWMLSGRVAVRVLCTGDDTRDWLKSGVEAASYAEAAALARDLIVEWED